MKRTLKKITSVLLVFVMLLGFVPTAELAGIDLDGIFAGIVAKAAGVTYNPDAAIAFAKKHCETDAKNNTATSGEKACDEGWLCAEFVAECLVEGGFPKKLSAVAGLGGFAGQITKYGEKIESTKTGSGQVKMSSFSKTLSKGDPIVILYGYGNGSGNGHVVIYSGETSADGVVKVYAHNKRNQNEKLYADSRTVEIFAVHINSTGTTHNKPVITSAKGESHSEIVLKWKSVDSATKYKVERRKAGDDSYVTAISSTTATTFTDTGLEKGQRYYYKVTAYNGSAKLDTSESVGVYTKFSPPTVSAESNAKLKISWDSVAKAESYTIMRRMAGADEYEEIKTVTGTSYTDTGLSSATQYYYWIKANCVVDGEDIVAKSTTGSQYTLTDAPKNVKADDISESEITITWNAVDGASSYRVARRKSGTENYSTVKASTTETSFADSGLETGERYYYRVYAKNSAGESEHSDTVGAYTKFAAPSVKTVSSSQLQISWKSVGNAESYIVKRRCYNETDYKEIATTTSTTFTDSGLQSGTKYYYWIQASCNVDDTSLTAKSVTGEAFTQLANPSVTVLNDTSVKLTWNQVKGHGTYKYIVQRKLSTESSYKSVATVTTTAYTDTNLKSSTTYNYRIQIVDGNGNVCLNTSSVSAKTMQCSHSYSSWTVSKNATCVEVGSEYRVCTKCSSKETRDIAATGKHTAGEWQVTKKASCTENGVKVKKCTVCSTIMQTEYEPKSNHISGEWQITISATTENEGKRIKKCVTCGAIVEEEIIPKIPKPSTTSPTEPTSTSTTEPSTKPVTEPATEAVTKPVTEPSTTKPVEIPLTTEPVTIPTETTTVPPESLTEPSTKPAEYTTNPATKPAETLTEPVVKPTEPVTGPAEPTTKPTELTTAPTTIPSEPTAKPTEPATKPVEIPSTTKPTTTKPVVTVPAMNVEIRNPSQTEISYGDSIILHVDAENLPEGATIKWTADNGNFTYTASADGTTCTVSPSASGDTTFTATVYDKDGNEIGSDTQTMTAKAGFFQKLIAFFKKLFGLTKVIPEMIKF